MLKSGNPRVLLYDTETSPVLAWIWRCGKNQYISHDQIYSASRFDVICIAWKWLGEKEVHSLDWGVNKQDSSRMIEEFTKVVESADLVVAHNNDRFDKLQINTQRLRHGQAPIAWPQGEDTLKQLRANFFFPSYKLDYLAKTLTGSGKDPMAFQDWIQIVQHKDPKALARMIKYCRRDVLKLEEVYKLVSPYCKPKVHAGLLTGAGSLACPRCGHSGTIAWGAITLTSGRYQRRRCSACAHTFRLPKRLQEGCDGRYS